MKEKHLYILAGVFVFLLIIQFVTKPRHTSVNLDDFVQSILIGVSRDDVRNIEIYKQIAGKEALQMQFARVEDKWFIPTYFNCKAQKSRIDQLLDNLIEMTGKVRSSDPKHFEKYLISDEQGIHLILKDEADKPLANLILGKKGEDANTGFVRFGGKEKVYFVDKNILSQLGIYGEIDTVSVFKYSSFVDLQAVDENEVNYAMVGLVANGKQMVLKKNEKQVEVTNADSTKSTKTEYEWVLLEGRMKEKALDKKEVANFFRDVTKIRGTEIVDRIGNTLGDLNKSARYGFSRASNQIVFVDAENNQKNIIFGKEYEKDKGYYMNIREDGLIYKVSKSTYDKIFKWMEDLPKKKV
ncbi:MAG: DUF4340 domain-containing protein [Candidatus Zhuqueibacterota bacterium]